MHTQIVCIGLETSSYTVTSPLGMALSIDDLGEVFEGLHGTRKKWYDIGLKLGVPVVELDRIHCEHADSHSSLRETLKTWLKTANKPTWQSIVGTLKSVIVGEPKLAQDIEARYTAETGQTCEEVTPKRAPSRCEQQQILHPMTQEKPLPVLGPWQTFEAPEASRGSAVSDGQIAYFNCGGSTVVHAYDSQIQKWWRLPDCLPI